MNLTPAIFGNYQVTYAPEGLVESHRGEKEHMTSPFSVQGYCHQSASINGVLELEIFRFFKLKNDF